MAPRYRQHVDRILALVESNREAIDRLLEETMPNWKLGRLDAIDRNVLRIGIAELLYADDVPPKVAIHEAIRLAGRYGSAESPRFVNGVLDAVHRKAAV
jgi:N utilization substance protein B